MRLQIPQEDETGFEHAKDWLLDGFGRWLREERRLDDGLAHLVIWGAAIALDWKFSYDDGDLVRWTTSDVAEFLLRWCPRKLSVSREDSVPIPGSIATFTDYLAAKKLLAPGSSEGAALREVATDAAADFIAEMGNPANFGMAKSFFTQGMARGYDLTEEDSATAWMSEFNSLREDELKAMLPGSLAAHPDHHPAGLSLPPVVLPPEDAIRESRSTAPVLAMFARLAEFTGTGRRLTQNGNLGLADARELVGLLSTGDSFDERIGDRVFATRSSVDLPVLRLVFTWAKKAGVVRVQHGKVLATRRGLAIAGDPGGMYDRAVDALLAAGPATAQRHPKSWPSWPEVDRAIDSMVLPLLIRPYVQRRPVPLAELTESVTPSILQMFEFAAPDEFVTAHVGSVIVGVMKALQLAGVVRVSWSDGDHAPAAWPRDGEMELTPAGFSTAQRLLAAAGIEAPVAGRWAEAPAEQMLAGADPEDPISLFAEIETWRQRRSPEQALAELAAAVRKLSDPGLQNVALTIMSDIGTDLAVPYIREMAGEGPAIRGFALCWLADHGLLAASELYDPGDLDTFVYVLAHRLVTAGDEGLLACLAIAGGETAQAKLAEDLGRKAAPPASAVLQAIGRTHPAKPVAKAARKALFIMRSRG
jgi:hypothetical protein